MKPEITVSVCDSVIAEVVSIHLFVLLAGDVASVRNSRMSARRELTVSDTMLIVTLHKLLWHYIRQNMPLEKRFIQYILL